MKGERVLIVACDRELRPRRILRDFRLPSRYEARYVLADGTPRVFIVYAWSKGDAAASAERQFRELPLEQQKGAWAHGVERKGGGR